MSRLFLGLSLLLLSVNAARAQETEATGCLSNSTNRLENVALGETPAMPCKSNQIEVHLQLAVPSQPRDIEPFFVVLKDDEDVLIAENGPLGLRANCSLTANGDTVLLYFVSAAQGWAATRDGVLPPDRTSAGAVFLNELHAIPTFSGDENASSGASALAPDGSFMSLPADTVAMGLNVFGHGCIASGVVIVGTGTL